MMSMCIFFNMFRKQLYEVSDLVFQPGYNHLVNEDVWLTITDPEMLHENGIEYEYIIASNILTGKFYKLSIYAKADEFIPINGDKTKYIKWLVKNYTS